MVMLIVVCMCVCNLGVCVLVLATSPRHIWSMNALITHTHMYRHMSTHTFDPYGYDVFVIV